MQTWAMQASYVTFMAKIKQRKKNYSVHFLGNVKVLFTLFYPLKRIKVFKKNSLTS